tara:strand:- start:393 stop:575 length:183 start_codon:yes stop_codon:yes gene_type:complete
MFPPTIEDILSASTSEIIEIPPKNTEKPGFAHPALAEALEHQYWLELKFFAKKSLTDVGS